MSKCKYLKTIFSNFVHYAPSSNQAFMNNSPLVRGHIDVKTGQIHGIKREATKALYDLTNEIYTDRYRRGSTFKEIYDAVFDILMEFFGQIPTKVDADTVATIDQKMDTWFAKKRRLGTCVYPVTSFPILPNHSQLGRFTSPT